MDRYRIVLRSGAQRDILSLPFPARRQINHKICSLRSEPRPEGHQPLGKAGWYRLRLHGYSILHNIDEEQRLIAIAAVV